jgi:deoxyhypusine synthase
VYFQTAKESGARIYITGLTDTATGKELMFFEIPLPTE